MWRIINPKKMALAVQEGNVGRKEYLLYILIFVAVYLFGVLLMLNEQIENSLMRRTSYALYALNSLLPFAVALAANQRGDKKNFWYRFISIHAAIGLALLTLVGIATFFYTILFLGEDYVPPPLSWVEIYITTTLSIIINIMIYRYMRIASSAPTINNTSTTSPS